MKLEIIGEKRTPWVQVEIDGVLYDYNACSTESLDKAIRTYEKTGRYYIGSSHIVYVNGIRNEFKNLYHFFY